MGGPETHIPDEAKGQAGRKALLFNLLVYINKENTYPTAGRSLALVDNRDSDAF